MPLYKVSLLSDVVSGEVVVGVVPSLPMKGISFLLGNDVAGGRVKVSPIVSKSPMCEENQSRDEECHKVGPSENFKVRDNPNLRPSRLSESKRSCDVNEGQGKVELDEAKGERGKATRTSGHRVGQGHFVPRDAKVQAIVDSPSPSTKRELNQFLDMCRYVPRFSQMAFPLTDLLKKRVSFKWSESAEATFRKLKTVLLSAHGPTAPDAKMGFQRAKEPYDCAVAVILQNRNRGGHHKKGRYPVR